MTHEERVKFLLVVCNFNEVYKEKEAYKAYLESAAADQFIPSRDWKERCLRLQHDTAVSEIQDAEVNSHFDYATQGLAPEEEQALLEEVQKILKNLKNPVQ
jgi:hypothetical protein